MRVDCRQGYATTGHGTIPETTTAWPMSAGIVVPDAAIAEDLASPLTPASDKMTTGTHNAHAATGITEQPARLSHWR